MVRSLPSRGWESGGGNRRPTRTSDQGKSSQGIVGEANLEVGEEEACQLRPGGWRGRHRHRPGGRTLLSTPQELITGREAGRSQAPRTGDLGPLDGQHEKEFRVMGSEVGPGFKPRPF